MSEEKPIENVVIDTIKNTQSELGKGEGKDIIDKSPLPSKRIIDLRGLKFGKLTPIRYIDNGGGRGEWECVCDCGNVRYSTTCYLNNYKTLKSCGCSKIEKLATLKTLVEREMIGKKFNRLLITKMLDYRYCECLCDCGRIHIVYKINLINSNTKSCGCLSRETRGDQSRR
ncbi:MAG: hypothetical protein AABY22_15305, partial [Nanoarchaeota archaeon]